MKIRVLFLAIVISSFSLKGMEQSPLLNLPQEMIKQILVKQLESCTSFDEQLKEIVRLRAVNTYFNKLFADFDSYFMKLVLETLEPLSDNLTQHCCLHEPLRHKNKCLYSAALHGQVWLVNILLKLGADVNAKDLNGYNALHLAAFNGHLEQVALLINSGIDVNEQDNQGWTALHFAVLDNNTQLAKLLIANNIDVNMQDNYGSTALSYAKTKGYTQIASLIKAAISAAACLSQSHSALTNFVAPKTEATD